MKRPLRFCFLTTFYPPYNFGGDGIDVEHLAHALAVRGHDVTVIHEVDAYRWLANGNPVQAPSGSDLVKVVSLRSRLGVLSPLLTHQCGWPVIHHRHLEQLSREQPFDVVMFNNVSLVGGPGLLSFGGDAVRLYLAHEHWLVCPTHVLWRHNREACSGRQCLRCVLNYRRPPQLWRYTGYLESQLRHVDVFVARSEFSRDKHHEFGFAHPMEVLPCFISGELPDKPAKAGTPAPHPRNYFLFVGRLERVKGLHTLIPLFEHYTDADLLVVGDGEEASASKALAGGNPRVRFIGRVPNKELARYYEHAVAVIVPSVGFETFGVVLIEAFRHQTPVIARRIGPFPEIVEQSGGGELFQNEEQLIGTMRMLQQDPEHRSALGQRGYKACQERWSEDVVIRRYLEIVSAAARQRSARRGVPPPAWLE
jgi:glycosyltransferase involved in cell wall biosynthesis